MKSTGKLIIFVLTFLALTASAYAQSPREQLNQMVQQLQQTPNDNALREKIIKLATTLKPLPAIPEQAREPFVMGATMLKRAGDPAGAGKAVDLFTQALNIAPWFADAYYNRAVARQAAGQFESAIDDLKLYLNFKLTDNERREAQDKIYSLKADAQLASTKKIEVDKVAKERADAEKERLRPSMEGTWSWGHSYFRVVRNGERLVILPADHHARRGGTLTDTAVDQNRQHVRFTTNEPGCPECRAVLDLSLSSSGNEMIGTIWDQSGGTRPAGPYTR